MVGFLLETSEGTFRFGLSIVIFGVNVDDLAACRSASFAASVRFRVLLLLL